MNITKSLWVVLTGVSLCMANISGIVTDTGTTPIAGAVVQLEKGGQTATTGADGSFTLATTAILPVKSRLSPNGLSAGITGNLMTVTIGERAIMEVATFDLNGKALSNVRQTMEPGVHTIVLPQRGAGVYLYKVKSGNRELLLKGNSVGGGSSGSGVSSQGLSSNGLAERAKSATAFNDAILAKKAEYLNYLVAVTNSDTSGIVIKMISQDAGTVTDIDGNVYHAIRIGNQVWTVENLRVTKYNDGSAIPLDTSKATWAADTTPKYCYYGNTTNIDSIKSYGALYNWYVVSPANLKKIAIAGWHVPSDADWDTLQNYLVAKGYNWDNTTEGIKIGKSMAAKTDWYVDPTYPAGSVGNDLTKNNNSGFSALPGGARDSSGTFNSKSGSSNWWSATKGTVLTARGRFLFCAYDGFEWGFSYRFCGFSVRLVKD